MKILIVDDNSKGLDILQIMLESKGYEVMAAQNGQTALEMAESTPPGLVISDILMPVMDGFALCRECKQHNKLKDIPFIFYTATYLDERDEELALKIGADKFIRKPVEPGEFMKIIQDVIENSKKDKIESRSQVPEDTKDILKLYNERLVNKLEKKNINLEKEIKARKLTEEALEKKTHDLGERIKELNCLYSISTLLENPNISMEGIFQSVVEFIPPAWQYPEITCSRIIFNDDQYKAGSFKETNWKQSSGILVNGEQVGTIDVCYLEERPEMDEGPFLKEETNLINAIAEWIGHTIERKKAEENSKKLEIQLRQAQKMEAIGTLAGGIAHDFNNVLYPIMGFAEISIKALPENHPIRENLQDILQGAKRARDLVKQILLFSSQQKSEQKPIMLQPLIKETIKLLRSTIPSNIEILQDLYEGSGYVLGDSSELHEIVMNLCTNAYHAMEETGGTLKMGFNKVEPGPELHLPSKEYCCLSVSDTGIGIPRKIINKIFEPYFTTKKLGKGTGLGLSVIHGIVKNYNGKITVESKLDKGTVFNVYLPMTSKIEKIDKKPLDCSNPIGDEKILFVDDEEVIVKLGIRFLERFGYKVTGQTSSIEALALFKSEPDRFDLIITDMAMPGLVGSDLAKKLLEIRPDIPIILCTGFSERVNHETAKSLGITAYINKPVLLHELTSKVREILDQSKKG